MFTIYSKPQCDFCNRAKALLMLNDEPFVELTLDQGQPKNPELNYYTIGELREKVPNVRTVPQIFDDGKYVGGFDSLCEYLAHPDK